MDISLGHTERSPTKPRAVKKTSEPGSELLGITLLTMLELNRQGNHHLLNILPVGAVISTT